MARELVADHLAACCNILPRVQSVYFWDGSVQEETESLMIIKTTKTLYPALEERILMNHPYDTPEIVAWNIEEGSKKYLEWIIGTIGSI